jgi:hypothetical protein
MSRNRIMPDKPNHELHELLARMFDEQLTDEQQTRLGELLRGDPSAQDMYLLYSDLHAELALSADVGQSVLAQTQPVREVASPRPAWSRTTLAWVIAGIASTVAVLLLVTGWLQPAEGRVPAVAVATLTECSEDVAWSQVSIPTQRQCPLPAGSVELIRGQATLQMQSGAEVILEAPARGELVSGTLLRLEQGRISVRVPEQAIGFRVLTPTAEIIDLGTEFGVAVEDDGASEVHVFRGQVVARRQGSDLVVPVLQDEAGRIEADRGDFVAIESDPARFPKTGDAVASVPSPEVVATPPAVPTDARIVFLGEAETDCETFVLLTAQALNEALPDGSPRIFNSGESLPLAFRESDYTTNVTRLRPTHAVLHFGSRIAVNSGRYSPAEFEAHLTRLIDRLRQDRIEPILVTGTPVDSRSAEVREHLDEYNRRTRRIAAERKLRLADAEQRFRRSPDSEVPLLNPKDLMPTFAGCRELAATVLDVLGYSEVAIPTSLRLSLLPGAITHWKVRSKRMEERLDAASVMRLEPDATWRDITVPQRDKLAERLPDPTHSLTFQMRTRGFATYHSKVGPLVEAMTSVESDRDKSAWINLGGEVKAVWLNGEKVFEFVGYTGRHAGKIRLPVALKSSRNRIVIETGSNFFVSVTDAPDWTVCGRVEPMGDAGR